MTSLLTSALPSIARFLYTHNPFYLIGTLLILFGVQQCLGQEPTLPTSGLLVTVLGIYTLLLAGIALVVIRCGQIWDDARTILLVIVLLFFMLSTSLDFHLLFTLEEPWPGTFLLAGGLAFSVLLSESLLGTLKITLPAVYRVPYYLVLALLFAYPIFLGWLNYHSYYQSVTWALFGFPTVAALALLTLLPAARIPPWREFKSGTPWRWPLYPWSLFVYLTIGLAIRAWWLTIAFEPAKGPDAYFRPYFCLPLILAWAVLVLEMGLVGRSAGAVASALALPLIGLIVGFPGPPSSLVEATFHERLIGAIGSPPQLTSAALLLFYGYAWLRGIQSAEQFTIAAALLVSIVGPYTLDWSSLGPPNPFVIAPVAGILLGLAIHRQSTWRALAGASLIVAAILLSGPQPGFAASSFWQWHAPLMAVFAIALLLDDPLARLLRAIAWPAIPLFAVAAVIAYPWTIPEAGSETISLYLALLFAVSVVLWLKDRRVEVLLAVLATLAANLLSHARQTYLLLELTFLSSGLPYLAAGAFVVLSAFIISLLKMGLLLRAWQWLKEINTSFGRPPGSTT